jgi:hypothetical protein
MKPLPIPLSLAGSSRARSFVSPAEQLAGIIAEQRRRKYLTAPDAWISDMLKEHLWSKQREIVLSVRDNRKTAVPSCHGSGKSFLAARIAAHWITNHPAGEAFVVSSAPTGRQVRNILWREINRAHGNAQLIGRTNQTEWFIPTANGKEELVAFGMKPDDLDPAAFQGIHARYVLVIFDEAGGIASQALWEAADSLCANDDSRFLAIGNPDAPETEFHSICKPGSGWKVIPISAYDTPNFTGETVPDKLKHLLVGKLWVEEKRRKWGESNPFWISKVLGQFPDTTIDGLIPIKWVLAAQRAELVPSTPNELSLDVGGGTNNSTYCERQGPRYRIIRRDQNPDTMETCGQLLAFINQRKKTDATKAYTRVKVDEIGIGRGVVNRAQEQKYHVVIGVNVSRPAKDKEHFENIRAEGYWELRELFQSHLIDIDEHDDDLAAQLVDLRYKRNSRGKIQMESKDDIKARGRPSPDDADAMMLASLSHTGTFGEVRVREAAWG